MQRVLAASVPLALLGCAAPTIVHRVPATQAPPGAEVLTVQRARGAVEVDDALRDADEGIALAPILEHPPEPGEPMGASSPDAAGADDGTPYRMGEDGWLLSEGARVAKLRPGDTVLVRGPAAEGDVDVYGRRWVRRTHVPIVLAGALAFGSGAIVAIAGVAGCAALYPQGADCSPWVAAAPVGAAIGLPLLIYGLVGRLEVERATPERAGIALHVAPIPLGLVGALGGTF